MKKEVKNKTKPNNQVQAKKEKKISVFEIIKESFTKWKENFIIVLPIIFLLVSTLLLIFLFLIVYGGVFLARFGSEVLESVSVENLASLLTPGFVVILFLVLLIGILCYFLISSYFSSGMLGMAKDCLNNKKISLKTMHEYGKKFFKRYFYLSLILILFLLGLFVLFFALANLIFSNSILDSVINGTFNVSNLFLIFLFVIFVFVIPLIIFLLFYLSYYFLIKDNTNIKNSIKKSFKLARKNLFSLLGLVVLYVIISLLVSFLLSFVPFLGTLIDFGFTLLVWTPIFIISFMKFVINRA